MKKYFIVADVHGFYDELIAALNKNDFDYNNPDHIFVSLGDLLDRGSQPFECLDFVMSLPKERRILIMGNHELLLDEMLTRGDALYHDITNGTVKTVQDITGIEYSTDAIISMRHNELWKEYFTNCQFYTEIDNNIFVHGWIPCYTYPKMWKDTYDYNPLWRQCGPREWENATWYNGMYMWANGILEKGKTIWCGHWHTSWGHSTIHHDGVEFLCDEYHSYTKDEMEAKGFYEKLTPFIDDGIVAMDACTAYSGFINCKVIKEGDN